MNKQVEQIKVEVESLINQLNVEKGNSKHPFTDISINERLATLEEVLDIINSLSEEHVSEGLDTEHAIDMAYLQNWYQDSIDTTKEPIWTDEHLKELFKDFYLIPKK